MNRVETVLLKAPYGPKRKRRRWKLWLPYALALENESVLFGKPTFSKSFFIPSRKRA